MAKVTRNVSFTVHELKAAIGRICGDQYENWNNRGGHTFFAFGGPNIHAHCIITLFGVHGDYGKKFSSFTIESDRLAGVDYSHFEEKEAEKALTTFANDICNQL